MRKANKVLSVILVLALVFIFMPLDALAKGGGGFSGGGGGRSFSSGGGGGFGGGSRSFSSPSPSRSFSTPSIPSSSSRSFSTPSTPSASSQPSRNFSSPGVSPSPSQSQSQSQSKSLDSSSVVAPKTQYDSGAGQATRKDLSQQKFDSTQPKAVSATTTNYRDTRIKDLGRGLSYERMQDRESRQQQTFGGYYGRQTPCCYSDPFGNMFFWLWLMDRPRQDRDSWVYNYRDEMDPTRYEELRRKDGELDRRLKELEIQGVKKDPSYIPPGVDRDLMYSDSHVKDVYKKAHTSSFPWAWVFGIVIILGLCYLIFFVRFNVGRK